MHTGQFLHHRRFHNARPGDPEQRRHQGDRGKHRQEHHEETADGDFAHNRGLNEQQGEHRNRDRHRGKEHRASRGFHRPHLGTCHHGAQLAGLGKLAALFGGISGRLQAGVDFLAVAGNHEQPIINRERETNNRDHVEHENIRAHKEGHCPNRAEGNSNCGKRPANGHEGGEDSAEDQHHEHQRHRQADRLAAHEV